MSDYTEYHFDSLYLPHYTPFQFMAAGVIKKFVVLWKLTVHYSYEYVAPFKLSSYIIWKAFQHYFDSA